MLAPRFLAITPAQGVPAPDAPSRWLSAGLRPDQMALLVREPGSSPRQLMDPHGRLGDLIAATRHVGIPLVLSLEVRALADALAYLHKGAVHSLHLRGRPAKLEASLDPGLCIGRSAHAQDLDSDDIGRLDALYWTFAPVHPPKSGDKAQRKEAAGLNALRKAVHHLRGPVLALGGIGASQAESCLAQGAFGIAGISAFFGAPEVVEHHAGAFAAALQGVLAKRN